MQDRSIRWWQVTELPAAAIAFVEGGRRRVNPLNSVTEKKPRRAFPAVLDMGLPVADYDCATGLRAPVRCGFGVFSEDHFGCEKSLLVARVRGQPVIMRAAVDACTACCIP